MNLLPKDLSKLILELHELHYTLQSHTLSKQLLKRFVKTILFSSAFSNALKLIEMELFK